MGERKRLFIPFGDGLERSKGVMVTEPTKFEDLRNVFLFEGKAQIRRGLTQRSVLINKAGANLQSVVALSPLRSEGAAMGVGYQDSNREVHVNRLAIDGTTPLHVASGLANGQLFTLDAAATFIPPFIHAVDSFNKVFFAHDEPELDFRARTKYYDPDASPQLQDLNADLDDTGIENAIKFRGITRFLAYLVGWGFGSDKEPDRPDIVRVSLAGDPLIWDPRHFFVAGQRSEPVITCRGAGRVLEVFKETETHEIFGYSPETFGIRPADTLFGCVGSRLAVTVGQIVFFWSTQGPRMTQGGESIDLAIPLDIGGPDPAGLVAESNPEAAFADYDHVNRVVMFVWGRRVYALSIRQPEKLRWSYYEIGPSAESISSAPFFSTLATGGGGIAPTGWPIIQDGSTVLGTESIQLTWHNNGGPGANGTEIVEVWLKDVDGTGDWFQHSRPAIDLSAGGPNFAQTFTISSLKFLQEYEVSLRYLAAGTVTTGFSDADPALWNDPACPACPDDPPAYRAGLFTIADAVSIISRGSDGNNGLWERSSATAENIEIKFLRLAGQVGVNIEIQRERRTNADTGVQNINGLGAPDTADQIVEAFTVVGNSVTDSFKDTAVTGEQIHNYKGRFTGPGAAPPGPFGNIVPCFAGPDPPVPGSLGSQCNVSAVPGTIIITASWQNSSTPTAGRSCPVTPPSAHSTEHWGRDKTQGPATWTFLGTVVPYATFEQSAFVSDIDARSAIRHKVFCFGVTDYSSWAAPGFEDCESIA